jgi:acetyl-CoA acyltransferase
MGKIVVVDAVRSAVGRAKKGSLANRRPDELAGEVVRKLMERNPQVDPATVEDLVLGCAFPEGEQGMNVARMVGMLGGLPEETSALTINRFCSSGLQAIALAAGSVKAGYNDVVIAGGMESMTMVPMTGNKPSASPEVMEKYPTTYTPMGITAENVANRFNISRRASRRRTSPTASTSAVNSKTSLPREAMSLHWRRLPKARSKKRSCPCTA